MSASSPREPPLPRQLNAKWTLDSLLGVGGMATVYAGTHRNGMRAAIKVLRRGLASDPTVRERFLREGRIANAVPHPGKVTVLDDDVSDEGDPFLVMELLEGEPLFDILAREPRLPPDRVLSVFEVMLGFLLVGCHAVGIIHRDIKPENIFITKSAQVKLLDFGVARLREASSRRTQAGAALGTPSYMAPEQARGEHDAIDGRADLFSVGACMWNALSGERLHNARSQVEALISARSQKAPPLASVLPTVSRSLASLVDRALAFDREARFSDAATMLGELRLVRELLGARAAHTAGVESHTVDVERGQISRREPGARSPSAQVEMQATMGTETGVPGAEQQAAGTQASAARVVTPAYGTAVLAGAVQVSAPARVVAAASDDDGTYRFVADPSTRRKKKGPAATAAAAPPPAPVRGVPIARMRPPGSANPNAFPAAKKATPPTDDAPPQSSPARAPSTPPPSQGGRSTGTLAWTPERAKKHKS